MAIAKVASTNGKYYSLTGTMTEVINALDEEGVPRHQIVQIIYNGTNITAVYRR